MSAYKYILYLQFLMKKYKAVIRACLIWVRIYLVTSTIRRRRS